MTAWYWKRFSAHDTGHLHIWSRNMPSANMFSYQLLGCGTFCQVPTCSHINYLVVEPTTKCQHVLISITWLWNLLPSANMFSYQLLGCGTFCQVPTCSHINYLVVEPSADMFSYQLIGCVTYCEL